MGYILPNPLLETKAKTEESFTWFYDKCLLQKKIAFLDGKMWNEIH